MINIIKIYVAPKNKNRFSLELINQNVKFGVQDFNLRRWHAVQQECSRWDMHAAEGTCSVAQMLPNTSFGTLSIPLRKPIPLLPITSSRTSYWNF